MCVSSLCETSLLNRKVLGRERGSGEARSLSFLPRNFHAQDTKRERRRQSSRTFHNVLKEN